MNPSSYSLTFTEFFSLWASLVSAVCVVSPVIVFLMYTTNKKDREKIKEFFSTYFDSADKVDPGFIGCSGAVFLIVPMIIHHGRVIFIHHKVDVAFLFIHFVGFLSFDFVVSYFLEKKGIVKVNKQDTTDDFYTDNSSSFYSKPKEEEEPNNPEFDFDASRFKSKKDADRYEKYKNMANDSSASASERETAMRKMIALDKKR